MAIQSKMVADNDPIPTVVQEFFRSLAPAQLSSITKAIVATIPERSTSENRMSFIARNKRTMSPKRPLNGFIAYRAYYSPVFKGATQKSKSGWMKTLWEAEKKRAMWGLLGQAYSDMRDHHTESIAVDKFLAIAVPLLPIIPVDEYLNKMGWIFAVDSSGESVLVRSQEFNEAALDAEYPPVCRLSLRDIVEHCYRQGLVERRRRQRTRQHPLRDALVREGLMTLQAAASAAAGGGGGGTSGGPAGTAAAAAVPQTPPRSCGALTLAVMPQSVTSPATSEQITNGTQNLALAGLSNAASAVSTPSLVADNEHNELEAADLDYLTIEHVIADQQSAYGRTNGPSQAGLHFHPSISPPILGFDPRVIQDDFDPFNLNLFGYDINSHT
ncbi:uncharacterized protein Z519_12107 [Cladophialophora bantiana CBS 173.52]|uniref:Alpha box domain-containing protein n=1 Tax=Cladophialophora bantiana (strain ATCC 10958 / CBS 173.52 / CDC B-1940 / NIH 8579) TaxID=1442370 RepID=A0A0D2H8H6_CLAB1|nr:uncharacterized protein Z519_12107 [Cladophialophora bantiana CBS 173.52]KIW87205.1 hypothetical protein Z519_12107 [Cladophialophora bantiana CBS 173.52]